MLINAADVVLMEHVGICFTYVCLQLYVVSYGDVLIAGCKGLQILTYAQRSWPLRNYGPQRAIRAVTRGIHF